MERILAITKALSDRNRLRILMSLEGGPLCLCQITGILALAASTVSKRLQVLIEAGLVEAWQEGRWHHFTWARAPGDSVAPVHRWLRDRLGDDATVRDDAAMREAGVDTVITVCAEELCVTCPGSFGGRLGRSRTPHQKRATPSWRGVPSAGFAMSFRPGLRTCPPSRRLPDEEVGVGLDQRCRRILYETSRA